MPRRQSKKSRSNAGKPRPTNRADAKVTKWNKSSDVPMDEEDLFHASRDKVLLGDNGEDEDYGDEDEVFTLKGLEDESQAEDDDIDMEEEDYEETEETGKLKKAKKTKNDKSKNKRKKGGSSDEEESEEEESWGQGKSVWYASNAAQLESDDEEGNELEEQEAKRLQSKIREEMEDADFGLTDVIDLVEDMQMTDDFAEPTSVVVEPLPQDKKALLRHLEKTSPETLALARDWEDTLINLAKTQDRLAKMEAQNPDALSLGMIHTYYQALLTYTTTLAFYLHLRSSEKYAQRPELLRAHPILQRLLTLKQSLATLEDLDFAASDSEDDGEDVEDEDFMTWNDIIEDGEKLWDPNDDVAMDDDELTLLLEEASDHQTLKETSSQEPSLKEPPRKKRKTLSTSESHSSPPVFDLVEPEFTSSKASSSRVLFDSQDAYGEATSLQHADAADKTARKKSLRFHTSKIESASARRKNARNQAAGGDDDIPYRERKKEKDARLTRENAKTRGQGGEDLDDTEPEPRPTKPSYDDDIDENMDGPDGYYDLVKKRSKEQKEQKKAEYDAVVEAARPDFGDDTSTGPRSLTRAILANKGLTPHRPKSVRNPRVKKRLKFEQAKKKLSSQKAVYKGGLANTGRYDGEKSGISKVVKSTRLG